MARESDTSKQEEEASPQSPATSDPVPLTSPLEYGTPAGGIRIPGPAALKPAPPRPPAPELLLDESVAPGSRVVGGFLFMALVIIGVLLVVQGRTSTPIAPTSAPRLEGRNVAVLFATTQYDDSRWPALKTPQRDAQDVAAALHDLYGFTVEKSENPSVDEIRNKIRSLAEQSYDASDQLLIMFSGHGDKDEILKKGWIIARDSRIDERKSAYPYSELREDIDNIPCPHILLILDVDFGATFDASLSESRTPAQEREISTEELIKRRRQYRSRLYISSADQKTEARAENEHSAFADKLLEALRSGGGANGVLTWSELSHSLEKLDPEPRGGVFPKSLNTDPEGDFLFVRKAGR